MAFEYIIYIPIVIFVFIYLLPKAKNKAFLGLFLLWLFGSPIFLNPKYKISLSFFGFDIQPNRFLFLVLTPILILWIITPRRMRVQENSNKATGLRGFEIAIIGYVICTIIAIGLNINYIGSRSAIADITNAIAFAAVYFCSKMFIKDDDFVLFQYAILIFAAISAIVSAYQFFINPEFFRLGVSRGAFSGYYRSNGLFTAEYDQGLFLTYSIVLAMSMKLNWRTKIIFISIAVAGIFLTMHRLSWLAMIFAFGMIWFFYFRKNWLTYLFVPLILITMAIAALNVPWSRLAIGNFGSNLIANRILADTVSVRFAQYRFSFHMFRNYPLGIGSYFTSLYNHIAVNQGIPLGGNGMALIIHNGFLSSGVKYGIFGMVFFISFIVFSIFYFLKSSISKGKNWYPTLMIVLIFSIFNLTNDFSFLGNQIGIVLAWLIGGYMSSNPVENDNKIVLPQMVLDPIRD